MFDKIFFIFKNPFVIKSILAIFVYTIPSGIIGSYITFKNLSGITGSISHAILGGISIAVIFNQIYGSELINPAYCGIAFSIFCAYIISRNHNGNFENENSVSTIFWVIGVALAIACQSISPSAAKQISRFMFGNLFWISNSSLYIFLIFDFIALTIICALHNQIKMICIDEKIACAQGINVKRIHFLLLSLVAITTTLLTMSIGNLLVIAFLNIPSLTANKICKNTESSILISCLIVFFSSISGIFTSIGTNIPPSVSTSAILIFIYWTTKKIFPTDT